MFKGLKMKTATRRVQRKTVRTQKPARKTFWGRVWDIICWPFRAICRLCRRICAWIRSIDLIGLVNLTLLIAIIVLFSMLIIDIVKCKKSTVVVVPAQPVTVVSPATKADTVKTRTIRTHHTNNYDKVTLPLKRDTKTRKLSSGAVNVVKTNAPAPEFQPAQTNGVMYGDIIVENRIDASVLNDGSQIKGNLYLQNMRKYTLPCDIRIDGNLFLRDVNMLQFCGDFIITGNIYVSPRSSFGPIPSTARLGGQVIL